MSREDKDKVKKVGLDAPSWLVDVAKENESSLDAVRAHRQLQRAKIVQGMTRRLELKQRFGEGAVLVQPGDVLLAKLDEPFLFVPLFHFTEFSKLAHIDDASSGMFQARTFDERSELARRARDGNLRSEPYGPKDKDGKHLYSYRYVEHLVFPGIIYGAHPLAGTVIAISFERGEFFNGTSFCSAILLRRVGGVSAPLWSQVWELRSRLHKNRVGQQWYGFDFFTPEQPFILEEESVSFREQHEELKRQFQSKLIEVDRSDVADDVAVAPSEAEM